jgi:dihydropteroate synthase
VAAVGRSDRATVGGGARGRRDSVTAVQAISLALGDRVLDITHRALVMGILNRTPDSFYDRGATYVLDELLHRADALVADGADLLDIGGVKAGPGPEVGEEEELDRVIPAIIALRARVDIPLSVDTWRASVARQAYAAGAVMGNDISGFADPAYLPVAAEAGATVVATHIRLGPRVPDPEPVYGDVVEDVRAFLLARASQASKVGLGPDRIVLDVGLDLGKTAAQSLTLLRAQDRFASLGYPLLLSASNKTFLGRVLDLEIGERGEASLAATALGVSLGCRIVRVHDVAGNRQVCNTLAAISTARRAADALPR